MSPDPRDMRTPMDSTTNKSIRVQLVRGVFQLRGVPLLAGLTAEALLQVAESAARVEVDSGGLLVVEGDEPKHFWILLEGSLSATRRGRVITTYRAGDFVGELAMGASRSPVTIRAEGAASLLQIALDVFEDLLDTVSGLTHNLTQHLAGRLRG